VLPTARITIGVMARAPVPGVCKTRLAARVGNELAANLCRAMLLDTLVHVQHVAPSSRLVVMAAPENDGAAAIGALVPSCWEVIGQVGEGLGARLRHAFTTLGAPGVTVALVAADSPTAPWASLRALEDPRDRGHVYMGPSDDGGYWLIGSTSIELGIFDAIAWSTSSVADETRARCAALGLTLEELAVGYDVDEPQDLERLRAELREHPERAHRTAHLLRELAG
jgi:uncharacterized protein